MSLMEKFLQNAETYEGMFREWLANGGFPPDQAMPQPSTSSSSADVQADPGQEPVTKRRARARGGKNKEYWGKFFAATADKQKRH